MESRVRHGLVCLVLISSLWRGNFAEFCYFVYQPTLPDTEYSLYLTSSSPSLDITINKHISHHLDYSNETTSPCYTVSLSPLLLNITTTYVTLCCSEDVNLRVRSSAFRQYRALEKQNLGQDYYVVCLFSESCGLYIGSVDGFANLTLSFLDSHLLYNLTINGMSVNSTVEQHILGLTDEGIYLHCDCDLTGAHIQSNVTITVFCVFAEAGDLVVLPLPPTNLWKSKYTIVPVNETSLGETLLIMTAQSDNYISVSGFPMSKVKQKGTTVKVVLQGHDVISVQATKPLFILYCGIPTDINQLHRSFLISHPSNIQDFVCLNRNTTSKLQLLFQTTTGTDLWNCRNNSDSLITTSSGSVNVDGDQYFTTSLLLRDTDCLVTTNGTGFGIVQIYEEDSMEVISIGESSQEQIEDYSYPSILYNTQQNDSVTDSYGTDFVLPLPANSTIKLLIACHGAATVVVTNISHGKQEVMESFPCNDTLMFNAINVTETLSTGLVRISSTTLMTVYVTGSSYRGLFSYLALPFNVLGYEYMAVTYHTSKTQANLCYITTVYTSTVIRIFLKNSSNVVLNGNIIQNDFYSIQMMDIKTIILESPTTDLSGTLIRGTKPFQLHCGGYSEEYIFLEQLIPAVSWDMQYEVRDLTSFDGFGTCVYRLVGFEKNTAVKVEDEFGTVSDYQISYSNLLDLESKDMVITSDFGIQVVAVCTNTRGDMSFSLVPGDTQLYQMTQRPSGHFSAVHSMRKIILYKEGDNIAANIGVLKLNPLVCSVTNINRLAIGTRRCFYHQPSSENNCTSCDCNCSVDTNFTPLNESLQERLNQLTNELTLDKTTLSSYKNTKISAPDHRPSSRGIGSAAIIILISLIVLLLVSDLPIAVIQLRLLKKNVTEGIKRFRTKSP